MMDFMENRRMDYLMLDLTGLMFVGMIYINTENNAALFVAFIGLAFVIYDLIMLWEIRRRDND